MLDVLTLTAYTFYRMNKYLIMMNVCGLTNIISGKTEGGWEWAWEWGWYILGVAASIVRGYIAFCKVRDNQSSVAVCGFFIVSRVLILILFFFMIRSAIRRQKERRSVQADSQKNADV